MLGVRGRESEEGDEEGGNGEEEGEKGRIEGKRGGEKEVALADYIPASI